MFIIYSCGLSILQSVTVSLVIPAVLTLYDGVVKFEARHLRKMVAALRDSLMRRFLGIFQRVKMAVSLNPQKEPFCDRLYAAAAVLDPNQKLLWVDHDVHVSDPDSFEDDDDPNKIANVKTALKGNLLMCRCTKNLEYQFCIS